MKERGKGRERIRRGERRERGRGIVSDPPLPPPPYPKGL